MRKPVLFASALAAAAVIVGASGYVVRGIGFGEPAPDIVSYLAQRAAAGDEEAARALSQARDFTLRTGLDLDTTADIREAAQVGGLQVRVTGRAPIYLNVDAYRPLDTAEQLDAYRAERHAALDQLAGRSPGRTVTVNAVFAGHVTVADAWKRLSAAGLSVSSLMVDVFATIDGERRWESRFTHHGGAPDDFLLSDADAVDDQIRHLLSEAYAEDEWYDSATLDLEVYRVTANGTASAANSFSDDPGVLLADLETDVLDAFADRAVRVRLIGFPVPSDDIRWAGR